MKTPMHALVSHLVNSNMPEMIARSRMNCHTVGLHSVMLLESPGKTIRLIVAAPNHELWKNFATIADQGMSVGFHAHHCQLTLAPVLGTIYNWRVDEFGGSGDPGAMKVGKFLFDSALLGGKGGFTLEGDASMKTAGIDFLRAGDHIHLATHDIHTVAVDKGDTAAWLVFEGKEDPDYLPFTYSPDDLTLFNPTGLCLPTSERDIMHLLALAQLY